MPARDLSWTVGDRADSVPVPGKDPASSYSVSGRQPVTDGSTSQFKQTQPTQKPGPLPINRTPSGADAIEARFRDQQMKGGKMGRVMAHMVESTNTALGKNPEEDDEEDDDDEEPAVTVVTYRTTCMFLRQTQQAKGPDPTLAQPSGLVEDFLGALGAGRSADSVESSVLLQALNKPPNAAVERVARDWQGPAGKQELVGLLEKASQRQGVVTREALRKYCIVAWVFQQVDTKKAGNITPFDLQVAISERLDVARELGVPPNLAAPLHRCIAQQGAGSVMASIGGSRVTLREFWAYYSTRPISVLHPPINSPEQVKEHLAKAGFPSTGEVGGEKLFYALNQDQMLCLELGWTPAVAMRVALEVESGGKVLAVDMVKVCLLRWAWSRLDEAHHGFISPCELGDAVSEGRCGIGQLLNITVGDVQALMGVLDPEGSGAIYWEPFCKNFLRPKRAITKALAVSKSRLLTMQGDDSPSPTPPQPQPLAQSTSQSKKPAAPTFADHPSVKYRRIKEIGQGAFGRVYLVERCTDGLRLVAKEPLPVMGGGVKAKKREKRRMLKVQEEAARVMMLKHPFVLRFVEAYWEAQRLIIVTEFCDGGDLSQWLARRRTIAKQYDRLRLFAQLADAVKYIHSCHIIHRDLKPPNILLHGPQCTVKVADFGVSRSVDPGAMAKTLCGTELYMAPEVHMRKPYGPSCDVFSLGCILNQLVTGKRAFTNVGDLMSGKRTVDVPKYCKSLVDQMLDKDPDKRPLAEDLMQKMPLGRMLRMRVRTLLKVWFRRRGQGRHWPTDPRVMRNVMLFVMFAVPLD
eukprot:Hpha_TRINITY_DN15166_c4_g8::TRINITY_DN15166_c4_g8_i1::g.130097::m.130097/K20877/NEK8; NIMA (never in mitosis gene a)-related kinase 8